MYIASKNEMKVGILKMNTIISKIDINNIDKNEIKKHAQLLKEGKTVIFPTETVYGLGANALTDHVFLAQFLNGTGDFTVGTDVDGITGATVTSKAIAKSINSAVAFVTGADIESGATSWGG